MEAALFAAALKPVAASLGFMGEIVVASVAQQLVAPMPAHRRDA